MEERICRCRIGKLHCCWVAGVGRSYLGWRRQDRCDQRCNRAAFRFQREGSWSPPKWQLMIFGNKTPTSKSSCFMPITRTSRTSGLRLSGGNRWFDVDGVDVVTDVGNSAVGLALQTVIRDKNKIAIYTSVASHRVDRQAVRENRFCMAPRFLHSGGWPSEVSRRPGTGHLVLRRGGLCVRQEYGGGIAVSARACWRKVARRRLPSDGHCRLQFVPAASSGLRRQGRGVLECR